MALIRKTGSAKMMSFVKEPSTAFALGDVVTLNASGRLIPAVAGSTQIVGCIRRAVLTTDADYAQAVMVPVDVPLIGDSLYEIDCSTTVTQAMVGTGRDLTNAQTLNVGAAGTVNQFRIVGLGSTTTKAVVAIIKSTFAV